MDRLSSAVDARLIKLVAQLNDLSINERVFLDILPFGQAAVPLLVELLLSKPSLHPQPRCLAAEALGILGGPDAVQGLVEVLTCNRLENLEPVLAMSEKAVKNRACLELGCLKAEEAIEALMRVLRENHLEGAARALTELRVKSAIPLLVECLEEDVIRTAGSECLLEFSQDSMGPLQETVTDRRLEDAVETNRSVARRAEAARLLGILQKENARGILRSLLWDKAGLVQLNAALALSQCGGETEKKEALPILLIFLEKGNWLEQNLCDEAIQSLGIPSLTGILEELEQGPANSDGSPPTRVTVSQATLLKQIIRKMRNEDDIPSLIPQGQSRQNITHGK
jgi:HEAT repeat protein